MKILKWAAVTVIVLLAALVSLAPIGPLPGVFIGGEPAEVPERWPDTAGEHEILLRVGGALPRVVTIWVVDHEGDLYVVGSRDSGWVRAIGEGAPVQMRLMGKTYSLVASPVSENFEAVLTAYVEKYRPDYPDIIAGFPTIDEASGQVSAFRLSRG